MKYSFVSAPIITIKDPKTGKVTRHVAPGRTYVRKGLRAVEQNRLERADRKVAKAKARLAEFETTHG